MTEDEARARLQSRAAELDEEDRAGAEGREPVTLQQDSVGRLSRMDAMKQQAMAKAQERRRISERKRIAAAIERLEDGEWGWCVNCGEEIAAKRLEHDPSVATCVGCASGQD